jgi:hypothetical protein
LKETIVLLTLGSFSFPLGIRKPCRDDMVKYIRRVEFLKGIINTRKLENPVERAVAAKLLPVNIITPNETTNGPSITTQIHQKITAKYGKEIRDELFQTNKSMR